TKTAMNRRKTPILHRGAGPPCEPPRDLVNQSGSHSLGFGHASGHGLSMDRITIVGAGAIGGWVAAKLAIAGQRPSGFARGDSVRLMRAEGVRLDQEGEEFIAQADSTVDCAALGEQGCVI